MRCNQCQALMINGVFCHETGCPNTNARYDADSDSWIKQRKCFECGCTVDADDPCCNAPSEDDDETESSDPFAMVRNPGKFEGEFAIVPSMWNATLEGCSEDVYFGEGEPVYSFVTLAAVDVEPTAKYFGACLWEDSNGFVHTEWYATEAEYDEALGDLEAKAEAADEDSEDA